MGTILDTITCYADAVTGNGGWDNLAAASGESLSIRWFEEGTKVTAFVALVAVSKDEPPASHERFKKQLEEKPTPGALEWPLRMFVGDH